ncbi:MAG: amidohydrolase [Actinomycetia bacterium]|nr:amidohydrolase [Actinomycetes bacterium]
MTDALPADLPDGLPAAISSFLPELREIRRDLHAHPELSFEEFRTTDVVSQRLTAAGISWRPLPGCTGLIADLGAEQPAYRVALRADIDALPVRERTGLDWASTTPDVCHACGHDVHTVAVLGAGLVLHELEDVLRERGIAVRLFFQPAEEVIPGGAHTLIENHALEGVDGIFAIHCDPSIDVGTVGLREGALTAACDAVRVELTGRGGHTSRPHVTEDLTFALAKVVTEVPAALSRRLDPRAGAALVWGEVHAGKAPNVIPSSGYASGTLRMLDATAWQSIGPLLQEIVQGVVAPYSVSARLERERGVPPVVNSGAAIDILRSAATTMGMAPVPTTQSLGGEDFSWYLARVPGAMARLGTRTPGGRTFDLHQGDLIVDEESLRYAVELLTAAVLCGRLKPGD